MRKRHQANEVLKKHPQSSMPKTTAAGKGKKNKNKKRRGRKGKEEKKEEEEDLTDLEVPRRARDFEFELDDFSTSQRLNKVKFTTLVALCERRNIGVHQIVRPKKKKKTKAAKTVADFAAGGKAGGGRRGAAASSSRGAAASAAAAAAAAASDSDSEDSTENPRLDFDDKQVLVDRILEWRAARKEKRREAAMFGELMRRRQEKFHSAARDAATPKVYKRMCRRCGLVWQAEEVPEQYGAFELRYAERDCERCRFPQRFRPPEEEEDPLDRRLREIRAMSVKQLTAEVEAQGLAATASGCGGGGGGGGVAASPTVYSAKYGSRNGPLRPRPSKAALVARLERHERRKQGRLKAGPPPASRRREPPARTRALTQGISLHAFAENSIRNDLRRLEERARQVLAEVDSGRPKTIQEYQEEFVARHIHIQAEREKSAAAVAAKQGEGQEEGVANGAQGAEGQRGSGSGCRGSSGKTVIRH